MYREQPMDPNTDAALPHYRATDTCWRRKSRALTSCVSVQTHPPVSANRSKVSMWRGSGLMTELSWRHCKSMHGVIDVQHSLCNWGHELPACPQCWQAWGWPGETLRWRPKAILTSPSMQRPRLERGSAFNQEPDSLVATAKRLSRFWALWPHSQVFKIGLYN